jgi:hypothetical protein
MSFRAGDRVLINANAYGQNGKFGVISHEHAPQMWVVKHEEARLFPEYPEGYYFEGELSRVTEIEAKTLPSGQLPQPPPLPREVRPTAPSAKDFKATNPKDGAATARLALSLFPQTAIAYGALAMTEGHQKYGGYNYREAGVNASVYVDACMRHLFKWYNGQEADGATGVPELASALACLAVLIDAVECQKLKDDRPPVGPMAGLLARMEQSTKALQERFPGSPGRCVAKKPEAA